MRKIQRLLKKPEYYYRPTQLVKRMILASSKTQKINSVKLLWGHQDFKINSNETIGKSILHFGLYDLALSEAIFRLTSKGGFCLDIGANIGYFTSLMSFKGCTVHAFEPHPRVFKRLEQNCGHLLSAHLHQEALSSQSGKSLLFVPENFDKNEGTSSLNPMENSQEIEIQALTIDEKFPIQTIDLMKVDVENHEISVMKGASKAFKEKRIRNIVFEDFRGRDSETIYLLKQHGFSVHRLSKGYFGLKLLNVEDSDHLPLWEPPNYIASIVPLDWANISGWKLFSLT